MLEKLFESLDEKVFTAELRESLEAQFNEAVEIKAMTIAESRIEEEVETLNEKSEQHIEFLNEKADEYVAMKQAEMVESLDKYLDRIVEEFVTEAKETLDESVKSEKADMIIEAFESMLVAGGVEVSRIVEAKDNTEVEKELAESVSKYDTLVEENINLKEENDKLLKAGIIAEMKEGMSLVESEKFEKLAEIIDFTRDESFTIKLETIKESVKGTIEAEVEEVVSESAEETIAKPVWAHLV